MRLAKNYCMALPALVLFAALIALGQEPETQVAQAGPVNPAVKVKDWSKKPRGYKLAPHHVRKARHAATTQRTQKHAHLATYLAVPDTWDCRDKGWAPPVLNQASCGDCHECSTVGCLGGAYLVQGWFGPGWSGFSIQHILDCGTSLGGCNGGDEWADMQWVAQHGLALASDYPGPGQREGRCQQVAGKTYKPLTQFYISEGAGVADTRAMQAAIMTTGPVSVAVAASTRGWNGYQAGDVITDQSDDVDHAVLNIGWKTVNGKVIFLGQNSWSEDFGDRGTFWIAAGACSWGTEAYGVTAPPPPTPPGPGPDPVPPGPGPAPTPPPQPAPPSSVTTITLSAPLSAGSFEVLPPGTGAGIVDAANAMSNLAKLLTPAGPTPAPGDLSRRVDAIESRLSSTNDSINRLADSVIQLQKLLQGGVK